MVASLMIFTLVAAVGIGAALWLWHMRKPENWHSMEYQPDRNIKQVADDAEQNAQSRRSIQAEHL